MTVAKPCLRYRSRSEAAAALRRRGMKWSEISEMIGVSARVASALAASAARRKRDVMIAVDREMLNALVGYAAKRKITPHELARQIIETAVESDLVDAILDDGKR